MPDESAGGDLLGNPSTARRLSPGETFYWLVDRISSTNFTVAARLTGPLDHDALSASLSAVQGRHPLLRVRISAEKEGPVFRTDGVGPIPLRAAAVPEGVWIAEAEREINETFDWRREPLVPCVWLRHQGPESTLMVTFHHAVGDGISGGYLMRDLLGAMAAPGRHRSPPLPKALPGAWIGWVPPRSGEPWDISGTSGSFFGPGSRSRAADGCGRSMPMPGHPIGPGGRA